MQALFAALALCHVLGGCAAERHGPIPDAAFDNASVGATHVPSALFAQLRPGGRMIIPLGPIATRAELPRP